jgi:hypothetical protein
MHPATVSSCQLRKGTARSSRVGLSQDAVAGIRSASLLRLRLSHPRLLFVAHCCCWRLLLLLLFLVDFFNFFFGFGFGLVGRGRREKEKRFDYGVVGCGGKAPSDTSAGIK